MPRIIKETVCKITYPDGSVDVGYSKLPPNTSGQEPNQFFTMQKHGRAEASILINLSAVMKIEYEIIWEEKKL